MVGIVLGGGGCALITLGLWFLDRDLILDLGIAEPAFDDDFSGSIPQPNKVQINNQIPTVLSRVVPSSGARLGHFETVQLWFSRPVLEFDSLEITANGKSPISVRGQGAGPFEVQFEAVSSSESNNSISLVVGSTDGLLDVDGKLVEMPDAWNYEVNSAFLDGGVYIGTLQGLPSAPSVADEKRSKAVFSIVNDSKESVDTTGWRLRFAGVGKPDLAVPHREISPGAQSLIEFDGLSDTLGNGGGHIPGHGRVDLLSADYPPYEIDAVDYEFSAAAPTQSLRRYEDGLYYVLPSNDDPSKEVKAKQIPSPPLPSVVPGRYSRPFLLELLSLDADERIWYTTDGTVPTKSNATEFSKSIPVSKGMVVKTCAWRGGFTSRVGTYSYVIADRATLSEIPTMAISMPKIDPKTGIGSQLKVDGREKSLAGLEVWSSEGISSYGNIRLTPSQSALLDSRFDGRAFEVQLIDEGAELDSILETLGLFAAEGDRRVSMFPAYLSSRKEGVDWLVDRVTPLEYQARSLDKFVNLVVNGSPQGVYRIQASEDNGEASSGAVIGNSTIIGDVDDWRRFRETILEGDLSSDSVLQRVEREFDVEAFSDYVLFGLFWGDRAWPTKSEKVIQHPITGKWTFRFVDLGEAGFQWGEDRFDSLTKQRSTSALFFESLLRSARFRRLIAERVNLRFEDELPLLMSRLKSSRGELERIFGRRFRQELSMFDEEGIIERCRSLRRHVTRLGILSPGKEAEHRLTAVGNGLKLEFEEVPQTVVLAANGADPVRFLDDYWIVGRSSRKRVWIPTSDRDFDQWKKPEYNDQDWIEVRGIIGFDKTGLSGVKLQSRFSQLMHNRSPGAFVRVAFDLDKDEMETVDQLILRCKINDGFVAYLNGREVARLNVPDELTWNSMSPKNFRGTAWRFREFDLTEFRSLFGSGHNILAVHGMNSMVNGPSFLLDVEIVGRRGLRGVPTSEAQLVSDSTVFDPELDFGLRQRVGDRWGPLIRIHGGKSSLENLRIKEIFLGAEAEARMEFVRIENIGPGAVDLRDISLTPLDLEFLSSGRIGPGEDVTFVRSDGLQQFASAWPEREIGAVYSHSLARIEMLQLWSGSRNSDNISTSFLTKTFLPWHGVRHSIHRLSNRAWGLGGVFVNRDKGIPASRSRIRQVRVNSGIEGALGDRTLEIKLDAGEPDRSLGSVFVAAQGRLSRYDLKESEMVITHSLPNVVNSSKSPVVDICQQDADGDWVEKLTIESVSRDVLISRGERAGEWMSLLDSIAGGPKEIDKFSMEGLRINEVSLPPSSSGEGWVEIYNSNPRMAFSLSGLVVGSSDYKWSLSALGFVGPLSYLKVPLPEHLSTLPALDQLKEGATIRLLSDQGAVDSMVLPLLDSRSTTSIGRWPKGGSDQVEGLAFSSPGRMNLFDDTHSNSAEGTVRLSELMAENVRSYRGKGDWLELYNPGEKVVSLTGMSLGFGLNGADQWRFPDATRVLPKSFLFLRCHSREVASLEFETRMNTGRSLNEAGDAVFLFDKNQRLIDHVAFGRQLEDRSIAIQSGNSWAMTKQASVGARNHAAAPLDPNPEISLAARRVGENTIECRLQNHSQSVADLAGWNLSFELGNETVLTYDFQNCSYVGDRGAVSVRFSTNALPKRLDQLEIQLRSKRRILVARKRIDWDTIDE